MKEIKELLKVGDCYFVVKGETVENINGAEIAPLASFVSSRTNIVYENGIFKEDVTYEIAPTPSESWLDSFKMTITVWFEFAQSLVNMLTAGTSALSFAGV